MINYFKLISNIKGIIQVGANSGQELSLLKSVSNNIILIEPIPELAENLKNNNPDCLVIPCALGSQNSEMDFLISSNQGESSSLLKPLNHTKFYPDINFNRSIKISVKTFESIINEYNLNINNFNVLLSDTQGYDLEVIKGFNSNIYNFDLIIVEYINSKLYENDSSLIDIENYLIHFGFKLMEVFDENLGAGNAVFIKN
jgi:hypothetical protein